MNCVTVRNVLGVKTIGMNSKVLLYNGASEMLNGLFRGLQVKKKNASKKQPHWEAKISNLTT